MLVQVHIILIMMAWNLIKIDAYSQVVDSRVLTNEISHFDQEFDENLFDYALVTTASHPQIPQKPYKFIEEPDDIRAQYGTSLTLNCVISHTNGTIQWTKNDFGLGVDRNLTAYKKYSMVGDEKNGSYSLRIDDVDFNDEGFYQCQFSNHEVQMRSRYATVSVFEAVQNVKKRRICLFCVGVVKQERFVDNGGQLSRSAGNFVVLIGVFGILSFI
ncbi:unnamed protein product [Chironomus riparius]|uniref:Ig-like domain-containing protein n=1 Tax=Chironomus riparius TaxID=315576 RepID=A0A9N9WXW3_9DIPT|nr:unnamed protein product [Chironomus riparius]